LREGTKFSNVSKFHNVLQLNRVNVNDVLIKKKMSVIIHVIKNNNSNLL